MTFQKAMLTMGKPYTHQEKLDRVEEVMKEVSD